MNASSPDPIGIGTAEVESLSGYVQRLAAWQETTPGQILHRWLLYDGTPDLEYMGRWRQSGGVLWMRDNINGFGHARSWVRILSKALRRKSLAQLTTRSWERVFPTRHFLAPTLKWCPLCLAENSEPYHRLLWALTAVDACARHGCKLSRVCQNCGKRPWVLHHRSRVTRCMYCAADLRIHDAVSAASEVAIWKAGEIGELIRAATSPGARPKTPNGRRLRRWLKVSGISTPTELGGAMGVPKSAAWYWCSGRVRPTLLSASDICDALQIHLRDLIFGAAVHSAASFGSPVQREFHLSSYQQRQKRNWDAVKRRMLQVLETVDVLPTAVSALAKEMNVDRRTLRAHEPELCRQVSARFRRFRKSEAREKSVLLRRRIRNATHELMHRGYPILQRTVATHTGNGGLFSKSIARRAFAEVKCSNKAPWPQRVTFPSADRIG